MSSDGHRATYYVAKLDDKYLHIDPSANQHSQGPAWVWSVLEGSAVIEPEFFNKDSNPYKKMWDHMHLSEAKLVRVVEVFEIWEEEEGE